MNSKRNVPKSCVLLLVIGNRKNCRINHDMVFNLFRPCGKVMKVPSPF